MSGRSDIHSSAEANRNPPDPRQEEARQQRLPAQTGAQNAGAPQAGAPQQPLQQARPQAGTQQQPQQARPQAGAPQQPSQQARPQPGAPQPGAPQQAPLYPQAYRSASAQPRPPAQPGAQQPRPQPGAPQQPPLYPQAYRSASAQPRPPAQPGAPQQPQRSQSGSPAYGQQRSPAYGQQRYPVQQPSQALMQYRYPAAAPPPVHSPVQRRTGRRSGAGRAVLAVMCVILAVASGFAGGFFASYLRQKDFESNPPSVYQPVDMPKSSASSPETGSAAPEVVVPSILTNTTVKQLMTVPEVASAVRDCVVEIKTETITSGGWMGSYVAEGAGSGVIISDDGYIVTNNHVISGAESITVRLSDGRELGASLIGTDAKTDIAVIKIGAAGLTPAVFGDSSKLVVGESAIAVGNPLGELGGTVTCGIISALDRDIVIDGETMSLLQTDAAVNPGNSGGGLFNLYGELIGVVNAKSGGLNIEGLGFAVPANTAGAVINDLTAYGYVRGRIDDGMELVDIQTTQAARMYRVNQAGLYIYSSKDERLQSGDRITAADGKLVTRLSDYNEALKDCVVGDTVSITVARGTQTLTFDITLSEWKP